MRNDQYFFHEKRSLMQWLCCICVNTELQICLVQLEEEEDDYQISPEDDMFPEDGFVEANDFRRP